MMKIFHKHLPLYCASVFLFSLEPVIALDLTPRASFIQGNEGPPTQVTEFTDGKNKAQWLPPAGWLVNGGASSASLSAPDGSGAWMKLIVVKKSAPTPTPAPTPQADADSSTPPDDMQAQAMQFIPAGAKNVVFVKTVPSPFLLSGRPSTEFIFTFARYGSRDSISISFVDYSDTERLMVIISAGGKDFEKVRSAAISSLFSWRISKGA